MSFLWERKMINTLFYFKYITIWEEFSELVWTRKCLDSILSSLSPGSGLNIYTLSRSCDAPLLSRPLLSPLPGFKSSLPASPSSRIWPHIAPRGRGGWWRGPAIEYSIRSVCWSSKLPRVKSIPLLAPGGVVISVKMKTAPFVSAPHSSTLPFSPARQGTRSCKAFCGGSLLDKS